MRKPSWGIALLAVVATVQPLTAGSARPTRPLPHDMIEGFGEGRVLAFHYKLSYVCLTEPSSDLDGPFGTGNGLPQSADPAEYQVPPCFFGDTGTGSIPTVGPTGKPLSDMRRLYGIVPTFSTPSLYASNAGNLPETQCSQPGLPITQVKGAPGTCLMHPSVLRSSTVPDPLPLPNHSHVIEGTSWPAQWWHVVAVNVDDASVWPDHDGNCPAGPPHCITSLAALRAAQRAGQAEPDVPSNLFFRFSVAPEAPASHGQR